MKVLVMTAMWPTAEKPAWGTFVRSQAEALQRAGVEIELLVLAGRHRKLNYLQAPFQLRRRLATDPSIDLVHVHYGLTGIVARMQFRVPLVVTFHGSDVLGTVDANGRPVKWSQIVADVCRTVARAADAIIVQSEEMASRFGKAAVHVVPHEIDFEVFRPLPLAEARAALGLDPGKKYLLFASDPKLAVKRFSLAAAATEVLQRRDPNVELLVVYREPQPRLVLYMNACDALIFPSYQEGSPNVVKQAMACNVPIVATDAGDIRQVIGKTAHCHICRAEVTAFVDKLSEILRERPRTNGRRRVSHLASPLVAQQIISIYEQALRRSSRRDDSSPHSAAVIP